MKGLVCVAASFLVFTVQGLHFGFGTMDWERVENTITLDITLGLNLDWEHDYQFSNGNPPSEGDIVQSSLAYVQCMPKECNLNPEASDVVMYYQKVIGSYSYHAPWLCVFAEEQCEPQDTCLPIYEYERGDKSAIYNRNVMESVCPAKTSCSPEEMELRPDGENSNGVPTSLATYFFSVGNLEVRKIYDAQADRFFLVTKQLSFTPPDIPRGANGWNFNSADFHCQFFSYARITDLEDTNGHTSFKMDTTIPYGVQRSAKAVGFAREYMAVGHAWTFTIPVDKVPGTVLRYEVAPSGLTDQTYEDIENYIYGSGLSVPIPGTSDPNDRFPPMDVSRLADEGILSWFIPFEDENGVALFDEDDVFPKNFAVQIWIVDDLGVITPYDFIIVVEILCAA